MDGRLSAIKHLFPVETLSPEILPCFVLIDMLVSTKTLFPVGPLSSEILPCSVLMDGPLSPI
jgi:hypothetical protein